MLPARVDVPTAVKFLLWLAGVQTPGKLLVRAFRRDMRAVLRTVWLDNRDQKLASKIKRWLRRWAKGERTILYGVNAFCREDAKAEFVLQSRLAHVDADDVELPPPGPKPTVIVKSSATGAHLFYELNQFVSGAEIDDLNRALARAVGGDSGHSRAKLFRLPGTLNIKPEYQPPPLIRVIEKSGPTYRVSELRGLLQVEASSPPSAHEGILARAQALDPGKVIAKFWPRLSGEMHRRLSQRRVLKNFAIRLKDKVYRAEPDDRSKIYFHIGRELKAVGATPEEALSVVMSTCFWKERGERERPQHLITKLYGGSPCDTDLVAIDAADFAGKPVPKRSWLLEGWIPLGKVTGLYGDGGAGKTTLAQQLAVCVAMGIPFLGMDVREGRAYALLAENDDEDTHISIDEICEALHVDMKDLRGKIRIASRAGLDSVLMSFVEGRTQTTALFEQLLRQVKEFSPVLVILETAADLFAGNENDRGQVRQFLSNICGRIATETGAAVVICAHPSVEGMRSGGGSGGSTAWNNTLRSRLWLRRDVDEHDGEVDPDVRLLELKKANFAQRGTALRLRWQEGVFVPDGRKSFPLASAAQQAREAQQIVATRYESDLPFSAYAQAGRRWLGHWVMETFRKSRRAATKLVDNWVSQGLIVEVRDRHLHRTVLCTPEQAKNARAKETR